MTTAAVTDRDRLARIEARGEIEALVYHYALNVRNRQGGLCSGMFTRDAFFEIHTPDPANAGARISSRIEGQDAIGAYVAKSGEGEQRVIPAITNLLVAVDGDTATATSLMRAVALPSGVELLGDYSDAFAHTAQGWQFTSRIYTVHWRRPA